MYSDSVLYYRWAAQGISYSMLDESHETDVYCHSSYAPCGGLYRRLLANYNILTGAYDSKNQPELVYNMMK